jgi:SUR7/PalI family
MKLKDFYAVYLWNYCSGTKDPKTHALTFDYCGKRQASYWFNPLEVWGLNETDGAGLAGQFPKEVKAAMKTYQTVARWMFVAYASAFVATLVEFIVGIFAVLSRWGSFFTTIISCVSPPNASKAQKK